MLCSMILSYPIYGLAWLHRAAAGPRHCVEVQAYRLAVVHVPYDQEAVQCSGECSLAKTKKTSSVPFTEEQSGRLDRPPAALPAAGPPQ